MEQRQKKKKDHVQLSDKGEKKHIEREHVKISSTLTSEKSPLIALSLLKQNHVVCPKILQSKDKTMLSA